uniref:NEDD1 gamma-tubulin ring complex targeting factor n=1 Tax=Suricata suricatta TaxID=37032 RepID=A0A673VLN0_SURSU
MQENLRFASSGDDVKIWDAPSVTLVDKFNPHTSPHGISSVCWSSNTDMCQLKFHIYVFGKRRPK